MGRFSLTRLRASRSANERPGHVAITGGAGGIGLALGRVFGRSGAKVVLIDVAVDRLADAEKALKNEGIAVETAVLDITDAAACERAFAAWPDLDLLINNAGISHRSLFVDTHPDVIRKVMEVNFFGAVHCTRAALPALKRRRGKVVALSSVAGFAPLVGRTAYAASKHALHGFFDTLRTELAAEGVGVLVVCPGYVATDLDLRHLDAGGAPRGDRRETVGRKLTPEEVAGALFGAVERGDREVLVSSVAHAARWIKTVAPGLYDRVMLRKQGGPFGR